MQSSIKINSKSTANNTAQNELHVLSKFNFGRVSYCFEIACLFEN